MRAWLAILAAVVIPGSGHVLLGRPMRGLMLLFWMIIFGAITWQLAGPAATKIGRLSGGVAVWVLSIVEVARMATRRPPASKPPP